MAKPEPLRLLRTVADAAETLGVSKGTVREWVASRKVEHVRFGRAIRIPQAELVRLVEESTIPRREAA